MESDTRAEKFDLRFKLLTTKWLNIAEMLEKNEIAFKCEIWERDLFDDENFEKCYSIQIFHLYSFSLSLNDELF